MPFKSTYNTVSVTSTATSILASNLERKGCVIFNNGTNTVFIGMDNSVTTSNGLPILANASFNNSGQNEVWKGAIFGITSVGSSDVRFWEFGI